MIRSRLSQFTSPDAKIDRDTIRNVLDGANEDDFISLDRIARDPKDPMWHLSLMALLVLRPDSAKPVVDDLIGTGDAVAAYTICGLIHDFGRSADVQILMRILTVYDDGDVRLLAIHALAKIGDVSLIPFLATISTTDSSRDFEGRATAKAALDAIDQLQSRS